MIKQDDVALCRESDPELWFPNPYDFRAPRKGNTPHKDEGMRKVLLAMRICADCPLFADGSCLEMAMSDMSTIEYGIWAGTLPLERLNAIGLNHSVNGEIWQQEIRRRATKAGIKKPYIPRRERPKSSLYDYLDSRAIIGNGTPLLD
jgi:hypothetical protein